MMDLEQFLQGSRLLVHLITVVVVASYCPDAGSAKRPGVSWFAVLLAGGSAYLCVNTLLFWERWQCLPIGAQLFLTMIFSAILIPIIAGRGNVASLLPRKSWSHRP